MKRKVPVRLLSFLLAGALTVTSMQMPVYAAEAAVGGEAVADDVAGAGTNEGQPDIETEEAGLPAEQASDSAPGDTEAADDADPGDSDAVLPESQAPLEAGEASASDGSEEITVSEGAEMSGAGEDTDAASGEAGEITPDEETEPPEPEEDMGAALGEAEEVAASEDAPSAVADMVDGKEVSSYQIIGSLDRTTYLIDADDVVDPKGVQLKINFVDGSPSRTVDITRSMLDRYNAVAGEVPIKVLYDGNDTKCTIDVLFLEAPNLSGERLNYGEPLSDSNISLPSFGYGAWSWKDGTEMPKKGGINSFYVSFKPKSSAYKPYTDVEVKVPVYVSLAEQYAFVEFVNPSAQYTYDGKPKEPAVRVQIGSGGVTTTLTKDSDYTVKWGTQASPEDNISAGEEVRVTVEGKAPYYSGSKDLTFTIAKADIKFTVKELPIYVDDFPNLIEQSDYEYVASGLVAGDLAEGGEPKFECNLPEGYGPGKYDITVEEGAKLKSGAEKNYNLPIQYDVRQKLIVTEYKPTTVRITGVIAGNKVYDKEPWVQGGNVVIRNGTVGVDDVSYNRTYSGTLMDGSLYPASGIPTTVAPTQAGRYTLTFELVEQEDLTRKNYQKERKKYTLDKSTASYDFTITQRPVTVKALDYTVEAGELVPEISTLHDPKTGAALPKYYTIGDVLRGDTKEGVVNTSKLRLRYSENDPSSDRAGEYQIIPYAYEGTDEPETPEEPENPDDPDDLKLPAIKNQNYILSPISGTLTVKGKLKFEADFNYIRAEHMNYSDRKHTISGSATGIGTYEIRIMGVTRDTQNEYVDNWVEDTDPGEGEEPEGGTTGGEENPDEEEPGEGEDPEEEKPEEGDGQKYNYRKRRTGVSVDDIVKVYDEIAPINVGTYTLEIYSEIDRRLYDYDGRALLRKNFSIFPLQKNEMKVVGVTGVVNKTYDGRATNVSEAIRNAKVWTKENIDITDKVNLEVSIREVIPTGGTSNGYGKKTFPDRRIPNTADMPTEAGEYELLFKITPDELKNFVEAEWSFPTDEKEISIPFVIRKRPLTVTVEDRKILVNAEGTLPDPAGYTYTLTDGDKTYKQDEIPEEFDWLKVKIQPLGIEDSSTTGSYDLVATGDIDENDKGKENNYEIEYVPGNLFVQSQFLRVKALSLTNNKNIPHGTTLEEIADKYLPKTVVIYLVGYKTVGDETVEETVEGKATIEWDTDKPSVGVYKIDGKSAQYFKMKGTVVLPDLVGGVTEENKKGLTVEVDISVREPNDGTRAIKPYADIRGGTVGAGTKVTLATSEEGAEIYYTIEADNPSLSVVSRRYTGPIEIQCTMTIRAVARVYGKLDSEELRLTYYYNKNYNPGGVDDPDDPSGPKVPDEDVPKDEDGKPLDIPKGMWITDVAQYTYTGKAVTPQVRVYDYKTRLEENTDYTVTYKNNVNAADKNDPKKAPSIVIKGKGNYAGTISKTFTIAPKNISDTHEENGRKVYDVKMDDITVAFAENKAQKPAVEVSWNGQKLVNKKDYIFESYPYTAVGTYPVTVTGNGNYTGERKISFTITNSLPVSLFTVAKISDYIYTGQEIRPMVVVMYQNAVVQQGLEYTVSYEDNVEIGTASVVIKGMGRFAGVKRVNFVIKAPASLSKADVELVFAPGGTVYTGKAIVPSEIKMAVQVNNNGAVSTRVLTKDDYKVTYQNNVNAGTATAIFTGAGAFEGTGTLKKTFKITPYNIQNLQSNQIIMSEKYPYMKGGSTQKPTVQFDGKTLQEGVDYTLSYKNHTKVGNTAVVTIKGKGNFTGSVMRTYQVTVRDISNVTVTPEDKIYKLKAGNYKTTVRVFDTNGKALVAGKDYDRNIVYTYAERTVFSTDVVKNAGDLVGPLDVLPIGTKVRATVTAIGNNYQGTATGTFTIVQANVAKAKVIIPAMTYTGKAIEPKQSEIVVTLNGIPLSAGDYRIVGYSNNVNKGTAKLTIQGQGNYGGTKTVTFKITGKSFLVQ